MSEKEYKQKAELMFERNTILINQLEKAKEIIRELLKYIFTPEGFEELDKDMIMKAEAFLKEFPKDCLNFGKEIKEND